MVMVELLVRGSKDCNTKHDCGTGHNTEELHGLPIRA